MTLSLRPVQTTDEDAVRAAHAAMTAEDFGFALGLRDGMAFGAWVETLADDGAGLDFSPHPWVPSTFLWPRSMARWSGARRCGTG